MILNARASNRIYKSTLEPRPGESFACTYNKRNRLASVTRNTVAYASYTYNALEQLTSRNTAAVGAPAGTVHYIYDNDNHLIAEANAATGAITRDYIWLASNDNDPVDLPLAIAESSTLTTVHADHLGRSTRMTDATKATVWQATWKPWGEIHQLSGTLTQNLRYPGQYFQIETGLHYNHHRHYDPITGRYTQPDPLRFVDGPSVYAYAGNSPYMNTDREGLELAGGAQDPNCEDQGLLDRLIRGRRAHNAFYAAVASNGNNDMSDFETDSSVGGLFKGRLDLYRSNGATWELKSVAYGSGALYAAANAQLGGYIGSSTINGGNAFRGSWSSLFGGNPSVEWGGFKFEPDNPSGSGLIFYSCKPPPKQCSRGSFSSGLPKL